MSNGVWTKVTAKTSREVCKSFALEKAAAPLLKDGQTPKQLFDLLLEKGHLLDAVRLLAHSLPKREAVWWALQCARQAHGANPAPPVAQALAATEKWVTDPKEENRRAAQAVAEAAGVGTPAGCAAMAAFWSGGSLAPPAAPVVPPPEHLTGHGAGCAVMLAAVLSEPEKAEQKHRAFLKLGSDVAAGANRWRGG
jgi:hypothetical protein